MVPDLSCHNVWWNNLLGGEQRAEDITYHFEDFSRMLDAIVPLCPGWQPIMLRAMKTD